MLSRLFMLILVAAAFSSCSTSYKSGQTPDDVYYSPAKETAAYADLSKDNRRNDSYQYDNADDRWLRMRVRNPYRWNAFDDYDWNAHNNWSNNFSSPYSYNFNSYWNGYYSWNSWYNPYCNNIIVLNPKTPVYTKVKNFGLSSYTNNNYNNTNSMTRTKSSLRLPSAGSNYSNSNSNRNTLGSSVRKVFSPNESFSNSNNSNNSNNNNSNSDRSTRTYTPSNSSSSGSSGSSSGSSGSTTSGGSGRRGG
ncbi:MAG: hypothetical protein H7Y31_01000 [Chitinophagaceae bacterium]|nr:hypothetical protein [Chitinophagaceae bacterium]